MAFDYSKLRGRIVEKVGNQSSMADKLNCSDVAFSKKMNNKIRFSADDIIKITEILEIPKEEIGIYFFTEEVSKS